MGFGVIIIGDELLSGRRQDRHFAQAIRLLKERGLELSWCRIIGDDPVLIVATLRDTFHQIKAGGDAVFCFGGIGATPDDHTRASAAEAAGTVLRTHPEAVKEIAARYGAAATPERLRLAELPAGSAIIPNPYNRIPGFSLRRHHFLPGFPEMAWPMMAWVLDHDYVEVSRARPPALRSIMVWAHEGQLLALMESCVERYPHCRLSSLPELNRERPRLELGVRGEQDEVAAAMAYLQCELAGMGIEWRDIPAA